MIFGKVVMITCVVVSNLAIYLTLPLHCRQVLLYVLIRPTKKIKLDDSFHTLMLHTTIGNLIFGMITCFNTAPASVGVLYDFYTSIGAFMSHLEMIKASPILILKCCLHVVLAASRFTAIAFPIRHAKARSKKTRNASYTAIWERISLLCIVMWVLTITIAVPLMIPGSTAHYTTNSVFEIPSVHYTFFAPNYYQIYSVIGSFFAAAVELITIVFYVSMIFKFNQFRKLTKSSAADVQKMTMGVVRTTVAAAMTSMGSWIIVAFFMLSYAYTTMEKPLLDDVEFASIFGLLNAINNVLTPWVLLASFPNVRAMLFFNVFSRNNVIVDNTNDRADALPKQRRATIQFLR